jgi:hypothetical protein
MNPEREELYVGYLPEAPPRLARRMRRVVLALVSGAALAAAALAFGHTRLPRSVFEYASYRTFEGTVVERPYPALLVRRPGTAGELQAFSRYLLVGQGKHGAAAEVAGLDGRVVRLEGSLVYRDGNTIIEVVPGSVAEASGPAGAPGRPERLGRMAILGEIVDSKCYLGVMNPGSSKPHRDCAVRCISGGAPPLFVARDVEGRSLQLLLVGSDGRALNREVLDFVAEPLEITGEVVKTGDTLVLEAEPAAFRRAT